MKQWQMTDSQSLLNKGQMVHATLLQNLKTQCRKRVELILKSHKLLHQCLSKSPIIVDKVAKG